MTNDKVKSTIAVAAAFVLVLVVGTAGWALLRNPSANASAIWMDAAGTPSTTPTLIVTPDPVPTTDPPPTPTPKATPTPKKNTKTVIAAPTQAPPPAERPKDDAPKSSGCTTPPTYKGDPASKADVRDALTAAAGKAYWNGVIPPTGLTKSLVWAITVPVDLVKAVAYQESGWQSNIYACDGGIGTMQVQPSTAADMNLRFDTDYDPESLSGNTALGVTYLERLIAYFGGYYFSENYDLNSVAAVGPGGAPLQLLDVVLAAYNLGSGELEPDGQPNTLIIPSKGQSYANNVKALRTSCPCLTDAFFTTP